MTIQTNQMNFFSELIKAGPMNTSNNPFHMNRVLKETDLLQVLGSVPAHYQYYLSSVLMESEWCQYNQSKTENVIV